jgi:hypothetical protein
MFSVLSVVCLFGFAFVMSSCHFVGALLLSDVRFLFHRHKSAVDSFTVTECIVQPFSGQLDVI